MRDTPETDATENPLWGDAQELCLLRDLCRKLERERDEARADCQRLNQLLRHETALGQGEIDHWAALEAERDEARCELEMWRDGNILHEMHRDELAKVERERDEAVAARAALSLEWEKQVEQANARVVRAFQEVRAFRERDKVRAAGEIAVLQKLMAERGFRVARGTYVHPSGERLPKWAIDRLDTPAWGGVWQPWELNAEPEVEEGELQTLFRLCATAMTKWDADAWMHDFEDERGEEPNVSRQGRREGEA